MKTDLHLDLVEKCKLGDRNAQFSLYRLYSQAMYNICMRMVKDKMDAEDILQVSFVDVFTKMHSFKANATIGAWIKRIVINNCINHIRKKRIYFEEVDNLGEFIEPIEDRDISLTVGRVTEAIKELPDGYRTVLNLYLFEGYDHKEIAEILSISEATSKSQYSRAKNKVRKLLLIENV